MAADRDQKYDRVLALLEELKAVADSTGSKVDALYKVRQQKEAQISEQRERVLETKRHRDEREAKKNTEEKAKRKEYDEEAPRDAKAREEAAAHGIYF